MIVETTSSKIIRNWLLVEKYSCIELKETSPTLYDQNATPMQKRIEEMVTGGRGYLSLQDSLNIVNQNSPNLTLYDALNSGAIPLYFEEKNRIRISHENPCMEIPLGKPGKVFLPFLRRSLTLLERLKIEQKCKAEILFRDNEIEGMFPPDYR